MAEPYSLLEFLQQLSLDDGLRAAFTNDPQATLTEHGLAGLTPEDVHDAAVLVEDTRTADFSLDHPPAPDPALGFLDSFIGSAYDAPFDGAVPADLGETAGAYDDLGDTGHAHGFGAGELDAPADFGSGHSAPAEHATPEHAPQFGAYDGPSYAAEYGEHATDASGEFADDLDDVFTDHADHGHEVATPEHPAH